MSGSGPTVFGLFEDQRSRAERAAEAICQGNTTGGLKLSARYE